MTWSWRHSQLPTDGVPCASVTNLCVVHGPFRFITHMEFGHIPSLVSVDPYVLDSATNNVTMEDRRQYNTVTWMVQLSCWLYVSWGLLSHIIASRTSHFGCRALVIWKKHSFSMLSLMSRCRRDSGHDSASRYHKGWTPSTNKDRSTKSSYSGWSKRVARGNPSENERRHSYWVDGKAQDSAKDIEGATLEENGRLHDRLPKYMWRYPSSRHPFAFRHKKKNPEADYSIHAEHLSMHLRTESEVSTDDFPFVL